MTSHLRSGRFRQSSTHSVNFQHIEARLPRAISAKLLSVHSKELESRYAASQRSPNPYLLVKSSNNGYRVTIFRTVSFQCRPFVSQRRRKGWPDLRQPFKMTPSTRKMAKPAILARGLAGMFYDDPGDGAGPGNDLGPGDYWQTA